MAQPIEASGAPRKPILCMIACAALAMPVLFAAGHAYAMTAQEAAATYGTRPPATCPEVKAVTGNPPPPAIAKMLVKCNYETESVGTLLLLDNVTVQIGGAIPYSLHPMARDADPHFAEFPIRGSFTQVTCRRNYPSLNGRNCLIQRTTQDTGLCWRTTFGDWKCAFGGGDRKSDASVSGQPPTPGTAAR